MERNAGYLNLLVGSSMALALCAGRAVAESPATSPAASRPSVSDAEALLARGCYDEAARAFDQLASEESSRLAATIGLAEAWRRVGRYAEALERLEAAALEGRTSCRWHTARAETFAEVGRHAEAIAAVQRALDLDSRDTAAHRMLGELCEVVGRREEAIEAYAWFDALLRQGYPARASALTDAAIGICRHAVLTRRADAAARTRYALHELLQPAYERVDRQYWPARIAAADLLLSKYNLSEAREDYEAALKINPHLAEAHVGLGLIALEGWDFAEVDQRIASALQVNARDPGAHRLRARLRMTERKYAEATQAAEETLRTNGCDLEALGLLAAATLRGGRPQEAQGAIERAERINPHSPIVAHELGTWLAAGRQFADAEREFKQAIQRAPEWAAPRTALGLMYMQEGNERAARQVLEAAWELDPYNAATKHTLDLLDRLERFTRDETAHFIIKSEDSTDAAIRPYLAAYLEGIYQEVCADFGGPPPAKTIVEVFPDRRSFAVRIAARPWIHTIGACTGRVIAISAPRAEAAGHAYNWANVLRHEFVHTVTLGATGNRIPHWLTEGLAVWAEQTPRRWAFANTLAMATRRGRLFDLESIDWGFARPRRGDDRTLAYAQSAWMVEYLIERHGFGVVGRMLEAFDEGVRQAEVFSDVVGQKPEAFIAGFRDWAAGQIRSWPLPNTPLPPVEELRPKVATAEPGERARLLIALAEVHLDDGDLKEAQEAIKQAMEAGGPSSAEALRVLLAVQLAHAAKAKGAKDSRRRREEAQETARRLAEVAPESPEAARVLAAAALEADEVEEAILHLTRLKRVCPPDPFACQGLIRIYREQDDKARLLPELMELARLSDDDAAVPREIADLQLKAGQVNEAIHWYRRAIHLDPYSPTIHGELGQLLMRQERWAEAVAEFEVLTRLEPGRAEHLSRLAFALHRAGRSADAKTAARRAVGIDPHCEAKTLIAEE